MKKAKGDFEPFDWRVLRPAPVVGVDEAGRGCLAGPVFAGAVILTSENLIGELTDSKLLSENRRDELFDLILANHRVGIGFATVEEIESLNILNAALLAMKRAVLDLGIRSGHVVVDGNQKIKELSGFTQTTLVKGDLRAAPVSAASIVAKVSRDRIMYELAKKFPQFGFDEHKGYATEKHRKAIEGFGPTEHHRKTFAGVREFISSRSL